MYLNLSSNTPTYVSQNTQFPYWNVLEKSNVELNPIQIYVILSILTHFLYGL